MPDASLLKIAGLKPKRLVPPGAWIVHIPFAAWIIQQTSPQIFVELGTHSGNSYFSFCQSVEEYGLTVQCHAVDTWLGDAHSGYYGEEVFADVDAYNRQYYAGFSQLWRMKFDEALEHFAPASIGLLHIDGYHTYEAVRNDFERWLPKLAPGAVVLLHDIAVRERDFGVWRFWGELQKVYPNTMEFLHSSGLGVLQLNDAPDGKRLPWLEPGTGQKGPLVEYFTALGTSLAEASALSEQMLRNSAEALQNISALSHTIEERDAQIASLDRTIAEQAAHSTVQDALLSQVGAQLQCVLNSRSWAVTRPLRLVARLLQSDSETMLSELRHHVPRLGKQLYWHLPVPLRAPLVGLAYRVAGPLFAGRRNYERWRLRRLGGAGAWSSPRWGMIDIEDVAPLEQAPTGRIAIHAHIFYADLLQEFVSCFKQMPFDFDLFVSVPEETLRLQCDLAFKSVAHLAQLTVAVVPNRGRDIAPMFCAFGEQLRGYDFVAHVHSKKSLHSHGFTSGWREYLLAGLFGSTEQIKRIFALLTGPDKIGMVYPQTYTAIPYFGHTWLGTRDMGLAWCNKLGIPPARGYFDFPAGSMFWARGDAVRPLFEAGIRLEDFAVEQGQLDGTLSHCLERLLGLVAGRQDYGLGVLRDKESPNWSRWRMDQGLNRTSEAIAAQITAPDVGLVVFDIFDTLLLRPLMDPEHTKSIVARCADGDLGARFLAERHLMEHNARKRSKGDAGLVDIYAEWARAGDFSAEDLALLHTLEERTEIASVRARPGAVALFHKARATGKRVVLASDMFLPKPVIERMLTLNGIVGWQQLYLSCEAGKRKDSGALYQLMLSTEGVSPDQVVVVGDDERSDVQIPADMGMRICHMMRPIEIARSLPRWRALVENPANENDLDASVGLGLVLRQCFEGLSYPGREPNALVTSADEIGYAVAGPLCLAFCSWLARRAEQDGIDKLYFLSREGAILKRVYDCWRQAGNQGPESAYLVVSRRSVNVPAICSFADILDIAKTEFFPNDIRQFLLERYGLDLQRQEWEGVYRKGLWERGKLLEVEGQRIEHLKPLLEHLQPLILRNAAEEKKALLSYLTAMGLADQERIAVVDVGYSGTVQKGLTALLGRRIDGYYMIANASAKVMSTRSRVAATGCFVDGAVPEGGESVVARFSFTLEKLLSSEDEQVLHYQLVRHGDGTHTAVPVFREQGSALASCRQTRGEMQDGILSFAKDAALVRRGLLPDFVFPVDLALRLFEALVTNTADSEQILLGNIVLDDYYCGRGMISSLQ